MNDSTQNHVEEGHDASHEQAIKPRQGFRSELHHDLLRIGTALEKQNDHSAKKGGEDQGENGSAKDKKNGDDPGKKDDPKGADQNKKEGDDKDKKPGKLKRFFTSFLGIVVTLVVVALLVIGLLALMHYEKTHESTDDSYTTGDTHQISPRVQGMVIERWVDDNQQVKEGDLLIKLDPKDYEVSLERAQANLQQSQAQVLQAQGQLAQADAAILQARAQVTQARTVVDQTGASYEVAGINYGRNRALSTKDARAVAQADVDTTKSTLDASKANFDGAKASTEAAEANVKAAMATRESRAGDLESAKAAVGVAQANLDSATLQLSYCWVLAPCDGRVSRRTVETGQQLSPGQAIMAITPNNVWILANYKETQLAHIRVGMTVKIAVDAFKGHPFTGRVDSIQNGSGATYSLLPPDNATGNFTKIVQRVPVKITFNPDSIKGFEDLIVPGLSCEPVIDLSNAGDRGDRVARNQPAPPKEKR